MKIIIIFILIAFAMSCKPHEHNFKFIDGHTETLPKYNLYYKTVLPEIVYVCDKWACDSPYCNKGAHQL